MHGSTVADAIVTGLLHTCRDEVHLSQQHRHSLCIVSIESPCSHVVMLTTDPLSSSAFSYFLPYERSYPDRSTDDGFFEEAMYRYQSNASNPKCITATIQWQHGTYGLNNNGSMTLYPFGADGRIQVQDPCAAVTNIITYIDQQVSASPPTAGVQGID